MWESPVYGVRLQSNDVRLDITGLIIEKHNNMPVSYIICLHFPSVFEYQVSQFRVVMSIFFLLPMRRLQYSCNRKNAAVSRQRDTDTTLTINMSSLRGSRGIG